MLELARLPKRTTRKGSKIKKDTLSYLNTASGLQGKKSLVDVYNATKGSRQSGRVSSEDAMAPEADGT